MLIAAIYLLMFAAGLWFVVYVTVGAFRPWHLACARAFHVVLFVIPSVLFIGLCTGVGLLVTMMFASDYGPWWTAFREGNLFANSLTLRVTDSATVFGHFLVIPYAFVWDIAVVWWQLLIDHGSIALYAANALALYVVNLWWSISEHLCGLYDLERITAKR